MKIEILRTIQNEDGSWSIEFDYDDEYLEIIKQHLGKEELTEEEISSFILSRIEAAVEHEKAQKQIEEKE